MLYPAVRPLLFRLDPERAHRLTIEALRAGAVPSRHAPRSTPVSLMGLTFPNRVGLAAGFDKNAEAVDGLGRLGFGHLEIGTVTPRPQAGSARPRVFRLPSASAVINRLGFPSDGVEAVYARLRTRRYRGVLGVNVGKNADTPLGRAVDDYVACLRRLYPVCDYVTMNISSPNTARLRELHEPARLEPFLSAALGERDALARRHGRHAPLLLKISPDLDDDVLAAVAKLVTRLGIDGVVATNTTVRRDPTLPPLAKEAGGLSGAPLHATSLRVVRTLRGWSDRRTRSSASAASTRRSGHARCARPARISSRCIPG
jgi:dihydroorotate dehydrogenase